MSFELFKGAQQQSEWRRLTGRERNVVPGWWRVEASHGLALGSVFGLSLWAFLWLKSKLGCVLPLASSASLRSQTWSQKTRDFSCRSRH